MAGIVLDSYAVLAFLESESGKIRVQEVLETARRGIVSLYFPVINLGEALYIVERNRGLDQAQHVLAVVEELPLEILEASRERVLAAAHLKARYPISYADSFIVAAAQEMNATILTGDPEFRLVEDIVSVEWLG